MIRIAAKAIVSGLSLAAVGVSFAAEPACVDVLVEVAWDPGLAAEAQGVVARLDFPEGVYVPADAAGAVTANVEQVSGAGAGALFDAVPHDTDEDGLPDRLAIGLLTRGMEAGPFVRISFSCKDGAPAPKGADFTCESEVSGRHGTIDSRCSVRAETRERPEV